jgi:peptide/nickel transport system substrate-binding protein
MQSLNQQQSVGLTKTNSEILQTTVPTAADSLDMRNDKAPFTDIRVRKALQMAIDMPTIAKTYFAGTVDGIPRGLVGSLMYGYYAPFDQWPVDVKAGYTYNPTGAKKLLAEAGYPNGFKTNLVTSNDKDLDLFQIVKSYFADIGVDMEIRVMDKAALANFVTMKSQDQMVCHGTYSVVATNYPPNINLSKRLSTHYANQSFNNDSTYDQMYYKFLASLDVNERKSLSIEMNNYAIAHYWSVNLLQKVTYTAYQPWLKGYSGEGSLTGVLRSRLWVDKPLKKTMGH